MRNLTKTMLTGVTATGLMISMTGASFAGTPDVRARMDALENELRQLKAQVQASDAKVEELEAKTGDLDDLPIFDGKKLMISSRDGKYSIRFGGRVQIDAQIADDDDLDPSHGLDAGIEFRRVRLFAEGKLDGVWKYKVQLNFDEEDEAVNFEDVYIAYTGFKPAQIKLGHFKEPFSLEELTSSKYITFMERALPNAFAPGRNLGIQASTHGDNWSASVGYFVDGVILNGGDNVSTEDQGVTARVHFAPLAEKTENVHLGLSAYYKSDQDAGERFRQRPEIHNAPRLVDTGTIGSVDDIWSVNPEVAAVFGPFSAQAEYNYTSVQRTGGLPDIDLNGFYVYASYFLTGESRAYNAKKGTFGRVKAHDAVELGVRYSYIELDDTGVTDSERGEESNLTVGLNYYFNPYVRTMLNYIYADIDHPTGALPDEEAHIFGNRWQVDF